ncbi:hypothetical protein ACIQUL_29835 [Streptomyces sp. NPDC090303]|uniref:hypothetical protein n=1 Tax=Streptomyces sp. NPDC090303 TaxID=3365960 RepID=UPI0037FFD6CC
MGFRIDLAVGGLRAAQLINAYRARLRELDLLDDEAALRAACAAYAEGVVYVVAAPGQIWTDTRHRCGRPKEVRIVTVHFCASRGHLARCCDAYGVLSDVPLGTLATDFTLTRWPVGGTPPPA